MIPQKTRVLMVDRFDTGLSISKQCQFLQVPRGSFYYASKAVSQENLSILRFLDEQYFKTPFYGCLRLQAQLIKEGYRVNLKPVHRLMKLVNWKTLYREPTTTIANKAHLKYPYLLKGLNIERKNQVWAMDITYIPMKKGFMYLTAIIDLHTRYVVGWSLSNTMSAEWCDQVLIQAIEKHGNPEIFNTDQGSQFTSDIFVNSVKKQRYIYFNGWKRKGA